MEQVTEAVKEAEKIEVSDEELDAQIAEFAKMQNKDVDVWQLPAFLPPATESSSVERRAGGMNNTLRIRWRRRIRLLICIRTAICSIGICITKNTRLP